jgi:hypothetical protein
LEDRRPGEPTPRTAGDPGNETLSLADLLQGGTSALVVTDIAALFNISECQVYKLAAAHRIPCFKIGAPIRFDPSAISGLLRQKNGPCSGG